MPYFLHGWLSLLLKSRAHALYAIKPYEHHSTRCGILTRHLNAMQIPPKRANTGQSLWRGNMKTVSASSDT